MLIWISSDASDYIAYGNSVQVLQRLEKEKKKRCVHFIVFLFEELYKMNRINPFFKEAILMLYC